MNRRTLFSLIGGGAVAAVALTTYSHAQNGDGTAAASGAADGSAKQITIWRDPGCGCCDAYADYLEQNGYSVTRIDDREYDKTSIAAGVPEQGLGCHLAMIEGYYVSGLVPAEILQRLVAEKPAITGITLPGMPRNAPGMAPAKTGTLKVYSFGPDGVGVYSDE
jgi:hypothetical protein